MAPTNRERIGRGLEHLADGLEDLVDGRMRTELGEDWHVRIAEEDARRFASPQRTYSKSDPQVMLNVLKFHARLFKTELGRSALAYVEELREVRNRWAHHENFSSEDTSRYLDTMERLLREANAPDSADDVRSIRLDLQRTVFAEQERSQRRTVAYKAAGGLPPWREVIKPHEDVTSGNFNNSEFAANLKFVADATSSDEEYSDPEKFYARTFLTDGLKELLTSAVDRISGAKSDAVINLQTNFGGGKTHSMLALHHLFSGLPVERLGQEMVTLMEGRSIPRKVRRVTLVGNHMSPAEVSVKPDGTRVHTMWGELAWQLAGAEGYAHVAEADRTHTAPGESLSALLAAHSPALILIDEWVAYARQLLDKQDLPAGSFETQFTFAQTLTEAVANTPGCLLVISVPASHDGGPNAGDDSELGGTNGQVALERLLNIVGRTAGHWRPSSTEESFEIVRRRLFNPPSADQRATIANVAREFATFYRNNPATFPTRAAAPSDDYTKRIRATYPLHPELLDRLHNDWATLERFQSTRGVLRLLANVIHGLWASGDTSPLIMPGTLPLGESRVTSDLTQYLSTQWRSILDQDVEGEHSTAREIDSEVSQLGQHLVTQRIARSTFFATAPHLGSEKKGILRADLMLGTAIPGDNLGNFRTATDELERRSHYFYGEGEQYWFSLQPSLTKIAQEYATTFSRDRESLWTEITRRLERHTRGGRGAFSAVHVAPRSGADVPDNEDLRLVIAPPQYVTSQKERDSSPAREYAKTIVESRGPSARTYRNRIAVLAPDRVELDTLEGAVSSFLAWQRIRDEKDSQDHSSQQLRQIEERYAYFDKTVEQRAIAAWMWVLVPEQDSPTTTWRISAHKLTAAGTGLADRCTAQLRAHDLLAGVLGTNVLGEHLNQTLGKTWTTRTHMQLEEIWQWFAQYPYLPRLENRQVLENAVARVGEAVLAQGEEFAVASSFDEANDHYRDLVVPPAPDAHVFITPQTLLVRIDVARLYVDAPAPAPADTTPTEDDHREAEGTSDVPPASVPPTPPVLDSRPKRYFASVVLPENRRTAAFGDIEEEVIAHLASAGSVTVSIEIEATSATGYDEALQRTVKENSTTLGFGLSDFAQN